MAHNSSQMIRTQGIILRRTNIGEADRIVDILTPIGRKSAIAKGVRRQKSKLAGGLELFSVCDIVLTQGKSNLFIITSARSGELFTHIVEEMDRLEFGYEVLKKVARLSMQIDEPDWFDVARTALSGINNRKIDLRLVKSWFFLHCAELSGQQINLQYATDGSLLGADNNYFFDSSDRAFTENEDGSCDANHIKILRLLQHKTPEKIAQVGRIESYLDEVLRITQASCE